MYLRDLRRALLRRWYFVIVGLLMVAALGVVTYRVVPATYSASANVVLLPPDTSVAPGANPYLYLGGLTQALDVLTRSINADATSGPILDRHPGAEFEATTDAGSGPILVVTATAPTAEATLAVLNEVLDAVPVSLVDLQQQLGVGRLSQITSLNLTVDQRATASGRGQIRAVVAVVAIGGAGLVLLIGLLDGLLLARKREQEQARIDAHPQRRSRSRLQKQSRTRLPKPSRTHERPPHRTRRSDDDLSDAPQSVGPPSPRG